jgi:DNA-binding response OmpR family regulator
MGFVVIEAADGPKALRAVSQHRPDAAIVSVDLGGIPGSEVLTKIRSLSAIPVVMSSARPSEGELIWLLDRGADDYVAQPYSPAELAARVQAVLRRGTGVARPARVQHGDIVVDLQTRTVLVRSEEVTTTRKEFDLLAFLATSPGVAFSREDLLERVWGSVADWQGTATVTEHIRRLRYKVESDPVNPQWIITLRGVGYRFGAPALAAA